jgi:hypothetical protein
MMKKRKMEEISKNGMRAIAHISFVAGYCV